MYKIIKRTGVAFLANALLDAGKKASVDDMHKAIRDGLVFDMLAKYGSPRGQLATYSVVDRNELHKEWADMMTEMSDRKSYRVEHNGFALLAAYALEGVQRLA